MKKTFQPHFTLLTAFILLAALSRLLPHPPNFTPIGGMALFGAAYFSRQYWAILVPLAALWISDLVINNVLFAEYFNGFSWFGIPVVYLSIILIALMGRQVLRKIKITNLLIASLLASVVFFLVTNAGSWWMDPTYPKDGSGLLAAYVAGIPFFWNTLAGDLFFTAVLFGGYELVKQRFPAVA